MAKNQTHKVDADDVVDDVPDRADMGALGADGLWALAIASSLLQSAAEARPIDLTDLAARIPAR